MPLLFCADFWHMHGYKFLGDRQFVIPHTIIQVARNRGLCCAPENKKGHSRPFEMTNYLIARGFQVEVYLSNRIYQIDD